MRRLLKKALRERPWNYEKSLGSTCDLTIIENVTSASEARERIMNWFKSPRQVQRFLSIHVSAHQSSSLNFGHYSAAHAEVFAAWTEIVAVRLVA
jgi:hypothetical protein